MISRSSLPRSGNGIGIGMKIYVISDLHGNLDGLNPKGVDLVLVAGDFSQMSGWGPAFEEKRPGLLKERFAEIPEGLDVLLTHSPPRLEGSDIDMSLDTMSPHFGSKDLTEAIRRVKPRYVFCGHIHTGDHNPAILSHADGSVTIVRNVSRLDEDYKVRYEPYLFEL